MRKKNLVAGMVVCLLLLMLTVGVYFAYAATTWKLTDDTLVADYNMQSCLARTGQKILVLTGAVNDNFIIYENGAAQAITTITLATSSEVYAFDHISTSYKIDWTGSTDTATLHCSDSK